MEIKLFETVLTGAVALAVPSISYFLTKRNDRRVAQHNLKLSQYQEFMDALAGSLRSVATEESLLRFARATNTLQLVASNEVIVALHALHEQISNSNGDPRYDADNDRALSKLIWEIRNDLNDPPTPTPAEFSARLWASGPPRPK